MSPKPSVRVDDRGVVIISIPGWSPRTRLAAMQLAAYALEECVDVETLEGVENPISIEKGACSGDTCLETELRLDLEAQDRDRVLHMLEKATRAPLVFLTLALTETEYKTVEGHVTSMNKALAECAWFCKTAACDWHGSARPEVCPDCKSTDSITGLEQHVPLTPRSFALDTVLTRCWAKVPSS